MKNQELLENILYALNKISNQKNVGKNGESSYDLASQLGKLINSAPRTTDKEQPKTCTCIVCLEEFTAVCSDSCGSCLI